MIPIDFSCFEWLMHQGGYIAGLPRAVCFHETYFHSSYSSRFVEREYWLRFLQQLVPPTKKTKDTLQPSCLEKQIGPRQLQMSKRTIVFPCFLIISRGWVPLKSKRLAWPPQQRDPARARAKRCGRWLVEARFDAHEAASWTGRWWQVLQISWWITPLLLT